EQITKLSETLDNSCSVEEKPSSKKKKNKKKTVVPETINPFYEKAFTDYPVQLKNTKAKGRHAVAARELPEGVTVSLETATAFVVRSEFIDQNCHTCLADLSSDKVRCAHCPLSYYCSKTCLDKDRALHELICSTFGQLEAIAHATDVEIDLLRLMLLLLARRQLDSQDHVSDATPFWCVQDLLSHIESAPAPFKQVLTAASERLSTELPESLRIPVEDMVALACRINSNAHGLGDNHSRNTDVALGLFPLGALFFNHGCNPNTAFVGLPNGQLAFRTIRSVQKDEELVVSYIDIYSNRDERRQELLATKHFWCKCKRCTSPMEKSVDRLLSGIVCHQCAKDVYIIPPTNIDILLKGQLSVSTEPSFKCAACRHEVEGDQLRTVLGEAEKSYAAGMTHIRQKRDFRSGGQQLERLTKHATIEKGKLHPLHSLRFNSYIPLMNCMRYNGNLKGAIETNKSIISLIEQYATIGGLPGNTSELSDYWQNLGELCQKMASECSSVILEKKWLKEARHAFQQALNIRSVVFGQSHPKVHHIQQSMNQIKV
ncbi:SET domain-containing protein, partial [Rhizopus microsporus var. microsporus]